MDGAGQPFFLYGQGYSVVGAPGRAPVFARSTLRKPVEASKKRANPAAEPGVYLKEIIPSLQDFFPSSRTNSSFLLLLKNPPPA
jgi:hypothetical protein